MRVNGSPRPVNPQPEVVPPSFTPDSWFGNDNSAQLKCPGCSQEYVHFGVPMFVRSYDKGNAWAGRGNAIEIPMWCENHCRWTLVIGFHKGGTFLQCIDLDKIPDDRVDEVYSWEFRWGGWFGMPKVTGE